MNRLIEQLQRVEHQLADERGRLTLFALFRREDALTDGWDLLVAAPWTGESVGALRAVSRKLLENLDQQELSRVARIVIINPDNPELGSAFDAVSVEHGAVEKRGVEFFGQEISHAYFITCRREAVQLSA